jgi:uncharacterized membrane protein YjjB (DUF3815 family)
MPRSVVVDFLAHLLVAVSGASGFAVVFRTPKRYFPATVLVGVCSCLGMAYFPKQWNVGFATFVVALAMASLSHVFARYTRAPAQCFLIPGVMFLVPGTTIYRAFSAALENKINDAITIALAAVTITVGISFGLLLANWLVPTRKTL